MANWTNLSAAFAFGTKLTSQQQQQLRDNITALAEGAAGAPAIETDALDNGAVTGAKMANNAGYAEQVNDGAPDSYYRVLGADGSWYRCTEIFDDSP
jgi:hypothetical protein